MLTKMAIAYLEEFQKDIETKKRIRYEIYQDTPYDEIKTPSLWLTAARGHSAQNRWLLNATSWNEDFSYTRYNVQELDSVRQKLQSDQLWSEIEAEIERAAQKAQADEDTRFLDKVTRLRQPTYLDKSEVSMTLTFHLRDELLAALGTLPTEALAIALQTQFEETIRSWRKFETQAQRLHLTPTKIGVLLEDDVKRTLELYEQMRQER